METLLMVAVVLIALAILAQAGVLIGMFVMSRRLAGKAERLMNESQKLMLPLETITGNLKTVSDDLTETGKIARQQVVNIQEQMAEVREVVVDAVDEARRVVMRPIRQYSAIASAIAEGLRTFFSGRKQKTEMIETEIPIDQQRPAA